MAHFFGKIKKFNKKTGKGSLLCIDSKKAYTFSVKGNALILKANELVAFDLKKPKNKKTIAVKIKRLSIFE